MQNFERENMLRAPVRRTVEHLEASKLGRLEVAMSRSEAPISCAGWESPTTISEHLCSPQLSHYVSESVKPTRCCRHRRKRLEEKHVTYFEK